MKTALIIIDVQNAILQGLGDRARQPAIDAALDGVASRLGVLKGLAEARHVPVILVQHDGDEGHRLAAGSKGWELRDEVAARGPNLVIHKKSCDAFFETDLLEQLDRRSIGHLIIGGCMSQFCVDTTVRRAVSAGYGVTLVGDGHTTSDMGDLRFDQIVAHHNAILDGFDAGQHRVGVIAAAAISFA